MGTLTARWAAGALGIQFFLAGMTMAADAPSVGGYTASPSNSKDVLKAARFALEARSKASTNAPALRFVKVEKAETQVVAGTNYRLQIQVREGKDKAERTAQAVVWWQPWRTPDPYQLTSWTWK